VPEDLISPFYETHFIKFMESCTELIEKVEKEKDTNPLFNDIDSAKVYNI
jgi:hypothetical protein